MAKITHQELDDSLSNEIKNKSNFDGNYESLKNTPVIPSKTSQLENDSSFDTVQNRNSITGELKNLNTQDKTNLVNAINEVFSNLKSTKKIYGIKIDTLNSDPSTSISFTDDAIGFIPANGNNGDFNYGSWRDKFPFNQIKPCLLKNGQVNYYLNPNDYTLKENGTNADITSGNDGDVMIEFPKIYWKLDIIGTDLYVKYSDQKIDNTWKCLAHSRGSIERDFIYLSAFLGYNNNSKLRSLSGKIPTTTQTIGNFRSQAQANGTGYEQFSYYPLLMLQILFIVMFKSRDSQTALGRGYVDGGTSITTTGALNKKGMFFGETSGKQQNKFCGIEDFWGNANYWVDGLRIDANRNILIASNSFNDLGTGYVNFGQASAVNLDGYINDVQGGTETGFIAKSTSGSSTTYFCDKVSLNPSTNPNFGGGYTDGSNTGAFHLRFYFDQTTASVGMSSRISFLGS